jgi:hypothetical protein
VEKLKLFPPTSGKRLKMSTVFTVLECLARAIRQEKEIKNIKIKKEEVKLPLFSYDMIQYLKNCKDSIKKLLALKSIFGKVAL